MALTFKGERTVAELNNNLGGFVKDSAFRIYDHGILLKGDVPVKHGDFVSWTGTQWKIEPSLEYATSADVEAVEEQVEALGKPLQWKGPATVSELNAGITGIQPGWTYTLTDAGTLTDGSVTVDVGDEVAWTEDEEWFKVGGENSTVAIFKFAGTDYPLNADMNDEFLKGKTVVLMHNPGGTQYDLYYLVQRTSGSGHVTMYFKGKYNTVKVADDTWTFYNDIVDAVAIAPLYDPTGTYPIIGTAVMYYGKRYVNNVAINDAEDWEPDHWTEKSVEDEIGNVEALLAAL